MQLVLASQSPRRKELLGLLGRDFITLPVDADETIPPGTPPAEAVEMLAQRKARMAASQRPEDLIVAADTVVAIDGMILGKPHSAQEAAAMQNASPAGSTASTPGCASAMGRRSVPLSPIPRWSFTPWRKGRYGGIWKQASPLTKQELTGSRATARSLSRGSSGTSTM